MKHWHYRSTVQCPCDLSDNCVSGLVVRVSDSVTVVAGSNLTMGHSQATSSMLLTYSVLGSTQPPILSGTRNE